MPHSIDMEDSSAIAERSKHAGLALEPEACFNLPQPTAEDRQDNWQTQYHSSEGAQGGSRKAQAADATTGNPTVDDASQQNGLLQQWVKQGYFMPAEHGSKAGNDVKHKYSPPKSDVWGVLVACTVITTWAALFYHSIFQIKLPSIEQLRSGNYNPSDFTSWPHVLLAFFSLEFLYTGLFITTHDAMHGTIAMRHRKLNDFLGSFAISLYAWFDYKMLHKKHWEHHNHTGKVGADPDFHRGNPSILPWFARFMMEYSSLWQFAKIAWWATGMQLLGAPFQNILMFMTAAPILSAFRLFYYGTYIPHHPEPGPASDKVEMDWTMSRTSTAPSLLSFLTCYHFDLHWEHHRWPYAPWWQLPVCRKLAGRTNPLHTEALQTAEPSRLEHGG
uniref:Beta-carotene 4-ketolase n=1 Tax=Protosiphon botryoides TaxID=44656 RepID=BKT_PROBT|nr:RecName: Full=Beta-carotene 4-ketolase; Short=PbBKT [Protosiphon botryoides]AEM45621.1 beta-carotene ketolase [Protosiphon botryoides]